MFDAGKRSKSARTSASAAVIAAVYCRMFSDTITVKVCSLRKKELNNRGGFTCAGCPMELQGDAVNS